MLCFVVDAHRDDHRHHQRDDCGERCGPEDCDADGNALCGELTTESHAFVKAGAAEC